MPSHWMCFSHFWFAFSWKYLQQATKTKKKPLVAAIRMGKNSKKKMLHIQNIFVLMLCVYTYIIWGSFISYETLRYHSDEALWNVSQSIVTFLLCFAMLRTLFLLPKIFISREACGQACGNYLGCFYMKLFISS